MIVTVDIGNSRVKCAQWMAEEIIARSAASYDSGADSDAHHKVFDQLFASVQKPQRVLAVCVGHRDMHQSLTDWVRECWQLEVEFLSTRRKYGDVVNAYADPAKHGADRWAAVVAARQAEPESPLCVISAGTAITFDLLEKGGQHLGGYILPSYNSMRSSLLSDTADLESFTDVTAQAVEADPQMQYHAADADDEWLSGPVLNEIVPADTATAIEQGLQLMILAGVREICELAQQRLGGPMKIIVTGGFAPTLLKYRSIPEMLHKPDLVMQGLYSILMRPDGCK
jgi:type III pantothenate kinase